jgi:hypothetical protein
MPDDDDQLGWNMSWLTIKATRRGNININTSINLSYRDGKSEIQSQKLAYNLLIYKLVGSSIGKLATGRRNRLNPAFLIDVTIICLNKNARTHGEKMLNMQMNFTLPKRWGGGTLSKEHASHFKRKGTPYPQFFQ